MRAEDVYPYAVTAAYPQSGLGVEPLLGNGVRVALVVDLGGVVRGLTDADLHSLGMTWNEVRERAMDNLDRLEREGKIQMRLFNAGPAGQPFILVGGHWAAATFILSRKLRSTAAEALGTNDLCASIPHREALLVFPKGDRASRDSMRTMIRAKEADGAKPLTWDLFELSEDGPKALAE